MLSLWRRLLGVGAAVVVVLGLMPAVAMAADWVGIDTGGGHQVRGCRCYIERYNPSPVPGASSAWPMMIDNSEGPGGFAQIGYAKSSDDWGDSRVYYFFEYEPAGQIVNAQSRSA